MKLKQVQEMKCGCTVENNAITMCPMHEAGPKLWKAVEQLLQAYNDTHNDTHMEENEYTLPKNMLRVLFAIEEILSEEEDAYNLIAAVADEVPGDNQNHQPKLS